MSPTPTAGIQIGGCRPSLARLLALLLTTLLLLAACSKEDDTEQIRKLIKQGAKLAEEHSAAGLLELTTEDFVAGPGEHDHRQVRRILWFAFNHYGKFSVMYPAPSVALEPNGREAAATLYFMIVKKDRSVPELKDLYEDPRGWLEEVGESADLYRLKLQLLKKNGDWLVRTALLEPFRGTGFSG